MSFSSTTRLCTRYGTGETFNVKLDVITINNPGRAPCGLLLAGIRYLCITNYQAIQMTNFPKTLQLMRTTVQSRPIIGDIERGSHITDKEDLSSVPLAHTIGPNMKLPKMRSFVLSGLRKGQPQMEMGLIRTLGLLATTLWITSQLHHKEARAQPSLAQNSHQLRR